MTVTLQLRPDVEAGLVAQARARGLSLEAYLDQILQERSGGVEHATLSPAERALAFEAWARNHPLTPLLSEAAVRRDSLIRDAP